MNGFWNKTSQSGFNVTSAQYTMLYDATKTGTIGNTIESTYALAAKTFSCNDTKKCTVEELFAK
jgi:hypothetical protein